MKQANAESDIDFLVVGGNGFKPTSVFAFSEELCVAFKKEIDVLEISEINADSTLYQKNNGGTDKGVIKSGVYFKENKDQQARKVDFPNGNNSPNSHIRN